MAQLEQIAFNGQTFNVNRVAAGTGISMTESGGVQTLSGNANWTKQQAIAAPLTGLNTSLTGNITASDTVLSAMGKLSHVKRGAITLSESGVGGTLQVGIIGNMLFVKGLITVAANTASANRLPVGTLPDWWPSGVTLNGQAVSGGSPATAATTFFNSPKVGEILVSFPSMPVIQYYFVVDFAFLT